MIRSTNEEDGKTLSNIRWNYGHITIPRHLRDIVVTKHGVANLRGRSDEEVITALLVSGCGNDVGFKNLLNALNTAEVDHRCEAKCGTPVENLLRVVSFFVTNLTQSCLVRRASADGPQCRR